MKYEDMIYSLCQIGFDFKTVTSLKTQDAFDILLRHWRNLNKNDKNFASQLIAGTN